MKLIHRQILRMLPGPLLAWMGTLLFLLLMQFLIRYLPDLVGKGLPFLVITELISYNLAYMVVLALPMSVLLTALITFGRLAESNAYLVIKSAGVSLFELLWPSLLVGLALTGGMWYFNNEILPEANFRAKNLWQDIHRKKPGFELQPGVFYDGLQGYSILVQQRPPGSNLLLDVLIYDYTESQQQQAIIKAERGHIEAVGDDLQVDLVLHHGELHRQPAGQGTARYERLAFDRFRLRLDLSDFAFERSNPREGYRGDRTMRTADMVRLVDSLKISIARSQEALYRKTLRLGRDLSPQQPRQETLPLPVPAQETALSPAAGRRVALAGLDSLSRLRVYDAAAQQIRTTRTEIDDARRAIEWEAQRADRYRVEIHKKYSIAMACVIFMLIGAPLGLSIRRGGLGTAGALALGIFLFYWVTLVQGEKLADRGLLTPWVGMWIANIVMILLGLWLLVYVTLDLSATPPLRKRLQQLIRGSKFKVQRSRFKV